MTGGEIARPTRWLEDENESENEREGSPDAREDRGNQEGHEEPTPPYALVHNDEETTRRVSISIGSSNGWATIGNYRLAEDHGRAVALGAPLGEVCRIDVDAEGGASARIALDPARVGPAPIPRFLLRGDRIVVSGVSGRSNSPEGVVLGADRKLGSAEQPDPDPS